MKIFLLTLLALAEYASSGPAFLPTISLSGDFVPMKKIPNTDLYTGVFYKIGMKKFPQGWITWTDLTAKDNMGNYVQIDINPKNLPFYQEGQKWFRDIQWMFEPVSEKDGFFILRNKDNPTSIVYSKVEKEGGYRHLILAKNSTLLTKLSPGGELREEALLKPVMTDDNSSPYKYQIKFSKYPEGTVTWTETKYGDYSKYIQVSENLNHKPKYEKGKEWWDDTLYSFLPEPEGVTNLKGFISWIEMTESSEKLLEKYGKNVKSTEKVLMTLSNPSEVERVENVTISFKDAAAVMKTSKGVMQISKESPLPLEISGKIKIPSMKGADGYTVPKLLVENAKDLSSSISLTVKNDGEIKKELVLPPKIEDMEVRVVSHMLENVELPFRALVVISGEGDRMTRDHEIKKGPMPPQIIMDEMKKKGVEANKMKIVGDKVMMWVTGTLKGDFNIGTDIVE